jgi:hypothetical protein
MPSIIPPFPSTILPNTIADATQVQTLLDWIRTNVNTNAQPTGGGVGFGNVVGNLGGSNVTLTSTAAQLITLTNVQSDPLSEYAGGVYTASETGLYACTWQWSPTVGGGGVVCTSYIAVNGAILSPSAVVSTPVGGGIMLLCQSINLTAGDTVGFYAQRNGTANGVSGNTYFTFGSVVRVQ